MWNGNLIDGASLIAIHSVGISIYLGQLDFGLPNKQTVFYFFM